MQARNLLYLNSMPFEMIVQQGRLWEVEDRNLDEYCNLSYSIFWGSKTNRKVQINKEHNICHCIRKSNLNTNIKIFKFLDRLLLSVFLIIQMIYICKKNRIDAIISQSNALRELELASLIASKICLIPMLGYVGRNLIALEKGKNQIGKIVYLLEKAILKNVDRVIVRPESERIISEFYKINPSKIITIPHRTKVNEMKVTSDISKELREWSADKKIIFYYGRFAADKLIDDIIKSFSFVKKKYKDVLLLCIGSGEYKTNLEQLTSELNLDECVKFKNSMPQEKIVSISRRSDIHIHPTGGKGLLESAMLGKPVITYDTFSYDYGLIEHMKTGLKAQFRNIENLADCINLYLKDQSLSLKFGEMLKKKAIEQSDWNAVQEKFAKEIENTITEKYCRKRRR